MTPVGWTIAGEFSNVQEMGNFGSCHVEEVDDDLHELVKRSFAIDAIGIKPPALAGVNLEEKRAFEIMEKTTRKTEDGWETGLLWREDEVSLPDSYEQAFNRLKSIERKMAKDPEFKKMYHEKIREYLDKGYLRKLSPEEIRKRHPRQWFIPHFGVTNPNKPGKFRFVLDAKAKSNGVSLNDKLLKGPDLIRPLFTTLLNFRCHLIAITGDICDMFHRIKIKEEDLASQRILWRDDPAEQPDVYVIDVMIFGATCSPPCAIYVKDVNASQFVNQFPEAVKSIQRNMYVDDLLKSFPSEQEAIKLCAEVQEICAAGNFLIRKWNSNSPEVLRSIPEDLRSDGVKSLDEHQELPTERVLGMWWNAEKDVFTFQLNTSKIPNGILDGKRPTKRQILSVVMSLYDPLGIINHFKVKGMMILQQTWRSGIGWDDELTSATMELWSQWVEILPDICKVSVPRVYSSLSADADSIELHTFVDSSEESYCAVCYLRVQRGEEVDVAFVASKVHVSPLKKTTIPRLELQAALLGKRLAISIEDELELEVTGRRFWSDSKTVLLWIRSSAIRFKEFVANRVGEIQEETQVHEWSWIPTAINVADIATRFSGEISFCNDDPWFTGPLFLQKEKDSWPKEKQGNEETVISATMLEILADDPGIGVLISGTCGLGLGEDGPFALVPDWTRFSSYTKFLRATATVLASAARFRSKKKANASACLEYAEQLILRKVQQEAFAEDIVLLKSKGKGKLLGLSPVLRNGLLCVDGRIAAARVKDEAKWPVILPSRHYVTDLIVDQMHRRCAHQGSETVLAKLRQTYWITDGREAVKRANRRCLLCKYRRSKPIIPEMGELPDFRLASHQPAFTFTGVDCFGPMEVVVGRRREKRWGVIFCCMVTRGIHLEVVHDMSTNEMMMALTRFISSRTRPQVIVSDNGTNFVGAANELKREWAKVDMSKLQESELCQKIDWRFNPPAAPHICGAWERLIQSVKKCISVTLKNRKPRDTTLLTVLKEAEDIVNSRPITYVSGDVRDPEPLTPNHFLKGTVSLGPPLLTDVDAEATHFRQKWQAQQALSEQYWRRWTNEYLPKLIRREKWFQPCDPLQVGDLVFVVSDNPLRKKLKRGVITKTFPGDSGQVRVVDVTTFKYIDPKKTLKKTKRRHVNKLIPLGLRREIQD